MQSRLFHVSVGILLAFAVLFIGGLYFFAYHSMSVPQAIVTPSARDPHTTLPPSTTVLGTTTITPVEAFSLDKLYSLINAYRREKKLSILKAHPLLEKSAHNKLMDMFERQYWTHLDPQGRPSWYLFETAGYSYAHAGETISTGNTTPWQVFSAWKESATHEAELLDARYEHMGAAVDCETYKSGGVASCVVVLHLGKPLL